MRRSAATLTGWTPQPPLQLAAGNCVSDPYEVVPSRFVSYGTKVFMAATEAKVSTILPLFLSSFLAVQCVQEWTQLTTGSATAPSPHFNSTVLTACSPLRSTLARSRSRPSPGSYRRYWSLLSTIGKDIGSGPPTGPLGVNVCCLSLSRKPAVLLHRQPYANIL